MQDLSKIYGEDVIRHLPATVMSGVESDSYWDICLSAGFDRVLMSYHYLKQKPKSLLSRRMEKHPDVKVMIDSGAYTFHAKEEEFKDKPWEFWEKYATDYVAYIRANKEHIFCCVELDIANLVGFEKQDLIRRKFFQPLRDEGILVCYVWHEYDGEPYWETMCKKYDFVAFSLQNSTIDERGIAKRLNIARRHGALCHGLACTRLDYQVKFPFFSVDSTTWLVGTQYGELNYFDGRKMKRLKKADWKTIYKPKLVQLGADWSLAEQENPYELIRLNALTFKKAEEYIHKRIRGKVYWYDAIHGGMRGEHKARTIPSPRKKKQEESPMEEKPKKRIVIKRKKKPVEEAATSVHVAEDVPQEDLTREDTLARIAHENTPEGTEYEKPEGWDRMTVVPVIADLNLTEGKELTKFEIFQLAQDGEAPRMKEFDAEILPYIPTMEWWEDDARVEREGGFVAKQCGIHLTDVDATLDLLFYATHLFKDGDLYEDAFREGLMEYAISLFDDVASFPDAVHRLAAYFRENMSGEKGDFLPQDTFGVAMERPKERESYLEEDEYEQTDLTREEEQELARFLPAPTEAGVMPDEELDRALEERGMVAVRDKQGRFLKGQKRVRKPKKFGSKHFPKLACNTCYKAGECPEYKPDHACAFDKIFKQFNTRKTDDVLDAMHGMADLNLERMMRLALFEQMDGGMPDPTLTGMIDQNLNILAKMEQLRQSTVLASQRRVMRADGSTEETTTIHSNPSGGSILEKLFAAPVAKDEDVEDAEVE